MASKLEALAAEQQQLMRELAFFRAQLPLRVMVDLV
jgi:hypothetical protein